MTSEPKVLHEQTGLRIVENSRNGFTVVTLHYTADPRKRSPEWLKASKQGLHPARWEQEFNISYDAVLGEKTFPEIRSRRHEIVIPEGPFMDNLWPGDLTMWGGFDYGTLNPSSFHVYTIFDGIMYALWELYEPCRNLIDFSQKILNCPYYHQLRYIAADPNIGNVKGQRDMKTGNLMTVRQQFETLGIYKFLSGNQDESAWLAQMQKHWSGDTVTFKILDRCPKMIQEFEDATFVSMTARQLETQNYREAIVDKHNHALDDCKYFMNSFPTERNRQTKRSPNIIDSYNQGQGNTRSPRFGELW